MLVYLRVAAVLCLAFARPALACEEMLTAATMQTFRRGNDEIQVMIAKNVQREIDSRRFDEGAREQLISTLFRCVGYETDSTHCKRLQGASHILEIRLRGKRFGNYRFFAEWVNGRLEIHAFIRQHDRKNDINRVIRDW